MSWFEDEVGKIPETPVEALALAQYLEEIALVRRFYFFEEVDSTSRWLMRFVESAPSLEGIEGTLAVANYQTAGKGRHERPWLAPRGKAILMSLLLAANDRVTWRGREQQNQFMTLAGPVSTAEAIREVTGLEATIKFPNDIIVHGRKCAGILLEWAPKFPNAYVLGIGVNVNQGTEELPECAAVRPTSLALESGQEWNRWRILAKILRQLEFWWKCGDLSSLAQKMNELCTTIGRQVRVAAIHETLEGVAVGISAEGALLVRADNGVTKQVLSGDVMELRTDEDRRAKEAKPKAEGEAPE
ncbi:MAG: biotin--[acetyl-CoA-carboxylase] ligase [Candidatus Sumerlaeaceae bacterium]